MQIIQYLWVLALSSSQLPFMATFNAITSSSVFFSRTPEAAMALSELKHRFTSSLILFHLDLFHLFVVEDVVVGAVLSQRRLEALDEGSPKALSCVDWTY